MWMEPQQAVRMARQPVTRRRWFLKEWRLHRGLSQEALADKIGNTQGFISQLELNQTNYTRDTLEDLARVLGCEPADLLARAPDPDAPWSIGEALTAMKIIRKQGPS